MKKLRNFITAILLLTLLTGCASTEIITVDKVFVPDISFPMFPTASSMTDNKDGTITVPADWIVRLMEYKIRIEETEKNYGDIKKTSNGGKK